MIARVRFGSQVELRQDIPITSAAPDPIGALMGIKRISSDPAGRRLIFAFNDGLVAILYPPPGTVIEMNNHAEEIPLEEHLV